VPRVAFQWPRWICGAIDARKRDVCGDDARWMKRPTPGAALPWLYCDRHKPRGAVRIPARQPFAVTRLELRVAVSGSPGEPAAAADEGVSRIKHAIEAVGGMVVGVRVLGGAASATGGKGSRLRLLFDAHSRPCPADAPLWEAPRPRPRYLARPPRWGRG
jgi:hypothetical protein